MLKRVILIIFCFVIQQNFSQHCSEDDKKQDDSNSISSIKKCKLEESENNEGIVSTNFSLNNRFLKKRKFNATRDLHPSIIDQKKEHHSVENLELANIKKNINSLATSITNTIEEKTIPFAEVDNVPLFVECDENSNDVYNCFNIKMQEHISNNFTYPEEALDRKMEGVVLVSFDINTKGNITNIKTISSQNTEILKKEAVRIVSLLPKFIPGKSNNKLVTVTYSFPMEFKIDTTNQY
ncbi:TonB family C-terminal domain-containing protein [Tenacibaculum sp. MAR_2009_124]|uniref:energy transducer TonB n=1 Tax=Tenacibaculum sp. MAR_2009_124 TaxID=1250059 RepID=UPI00089CB3E2|nr:energy transducer TonB [Tenacibaculum sp. MAR_2009_124]SEB41081.1 TonB family C-terminal domain-containing protein [Tenacibaculum sp. MAR_2009_124]